MLNKSLTIVLPVYNAESRLRKNVRDVLELASELTAKFGVLIVDDGSTDATFEVAEELAAHFPQVKVHRHRHRRGLGATIEYVQRRVRTDAVMVHDGVTPMDPGQMRITWQSWIAQSAARENGTAAPGALASEITDFANLPAIHAAMERTHGRVLGFQMLFQEPTTGAGFDCLKNIATQSARSDAPHVSRRAGVGRIPPPPRPKFLSALTEFALGE